jgi:hypothetical protein
MKFKITLVLVSLLILSSCSPENEDYISSDSSDLIIQIGGGTSPDPTNSSFQTDLMAGQNIYSGIVNVDVVNGNVVVNYTSESDWEIVETHLYIGDLNQLPTTGSGNPKVGQFPYANTHPAGTVNVEYTGPGITSGECVYVAAHAVVVNSVTGQTETAWGAGIPIGGNSWAMTFEYCY